MDSNICCMDHQFLLSHLFLIRVDSKVSSPISFKPRLKNDRWIYKGKMQFNYGKLSIHFI